MIMEEKNTAAASNAPLTQAKAAGPSVPEKKTMKVLPKLNFGGRRYRTLLTYTLRIGFNFTITM